MASRKVEAIRYERDKNAVERATLIAYERICPKLLADDNENNDKESSGGWPTRGL